MAWVLYVYAVTRDAVLPAGEAIDGSNRFATVTTGAISAVFTPVEAGEFSQEVIDQRAGDLEWLGSIGYRHQAVMAQLMKLTPIVPLRAFTLFSSEAALNEYLDANRSSLEKTLERLGDREEWTLRIEFEPSKWSEAMTGRVASLRALEEEIATASAGKGFLLRKKLEEEKKRASRIAEEELVAEIEQEILQRLRAQTVSESRERRDGAFPQINLLLNRDEESLITGLRDELAARYEPEGVTLGVTGPWPPYTFVADAGDAEGDA